VAKVLLYLTLLAIALVTPWTNFPHVVPKFAWFRATTALAVVFFLLGVATSSAARAQGMFQRVRATVTSPVGLAVTAFVLAVQLACLFGVDPSRSFWSTLERGEGGAQILMLYFYFLLLAALLNQPREWLLLFKSICVAGLLSVGFGVLDGLDVFGLFGVIQVNQPDFRFAGANGNPESFAAFALFAIFFSLYVVSGRPTKRLLPEHAIWLGTSLVFVGTLLWSGTRGALVGLAAGGLTFTVAFAVLQPRWRRPLVAVVAVGTVLAGSLAAIQRHTTVDLLPYSFRRLFYMSLSTRSFAERRSIWRMVWNGFLDRPLLGLGPENVTDAIFRHFDPSYYHPDENGTIPDRAHNVLLDHLATVGVIGTLAFLSIFVGFYAQAARRVGTAAVVHANEQRSSEGQANRPVPRALMLAMPVAYLVQNLVFFDTLTTYICLFTFLAFAQQLRSTAARRPEGAPAGPAGDGAMQVVRSRERPLRIALAVVGIPLCLSLVVMGAVLPYLKAKLLRAALESPYLGKSLPDVLDDIDQAVGFYSPAGDEETTFLLSANLSKMMSDDPNLPLEVVRALLGRIEPKAAPGVRPWLGIGQVYFTFASRASRTDDYEHAIAYFSKARARAPGLPAVLYPMFELYRRRGDRQGMAEVGEAILSRWPDDLQVRQLMGAGPTPSARR
jgi:O-antigen ligase